MNTLQTQHPGASSTAIQHHYDVSNEFYRYWLDESQTYSCALWSDDGEQDSLELAQQRKIDYMVAQARANGVKRVLDIGCGWGAVLRRLVDIHQVEHAVGLTLSAAQAEHIVSLNHPRIEVHQHSWLEHSPVAPYDAIISIGAFEHFARIELTDSERIEAYRDFFLHCHKWLKPNGWMTLQTISYGNMRREEASQFMNTDIFPESDLPRLAEIAQSTEGIFEVVMLRNDRKHYARTCEEWLSRLRANRDRAIALVGEDVFSRYERYLKLSAVGFRMGKIALLRLTLRRFDTLH
ncbi:cyclopropane-fatty-acyl-phospholipid synthase [Kalymmatonema gypsitolerans NIES-4073]|nr:cyclopropane-fatty-acyl-phospholipid synthase [Scytonema sp. NIES-4073]